MKKMFLLTAFVGGLTVSAVASADDVAAAAETQDDLDVTMQVVPEDAGEAVDAVITLPEQASDVARERAAAGLATANAARHKGLALGRNAVEDGKRAADDAGDLRDGAEARAELETEATGDAHELRADAGADLKTEVETDAGDLRGDLETEVRADAAAEARDLRGSLGEEIAGAARKD